MILQRFKSRRVFLYIRCLLFCYYLASSFGTRPNEIDREYSVSNKKNTRLSSSITLLPFNTTFLIFHFTTLIFLLLKQIVFDFLRLFQFEILFQLIIKRYDSQMFYLVIVENIIYRHYHSRVTDDHLVKHKPDDSRGYAPSLHITTKSIRRSYRIRSYCIYHILEKPKSRKRYQ